MADWKNDPDFTEPSDGYDRPAIGVDHLSAGDSMTLSFADDGEQMDTQYGPAVGFDVTVEETDGTPTDDEGAEIAAGHEARLITDSSRLLRWLKEYDLADNTFEIVREGEGYDTAYSVVETDE